MQSRVELPGGPEAASGPGWKRIAVDVSVAAGLVLAVAIVCWADRSTVETVEPGPIHTPPGPEPIPPPEPKPLRLAVTSATKVFDDMGSLLTSLGKGYSYSEIPLEQLRSLSRISKFDVIFVTCSTTPKSWLGDKPKESGSRFTKIYDWDAAARQDVVESLREFVKSGGTLYGSDWAFSVISAAFEEFVDRGKATTGKKQLVEATVEDKALAELIGKRIELNFDLPDWRPAAMRGQDVEVLISGEFQSMNHGDVKAPLLVRFPYGKGTVIFTSFHNETQNSKTEIELLKYLVFSAVTASAKSESRRTMVSSGFKRGKSNLIGLSPAKNVQAWTYQCRRKSQLQFNLFSSPDGARLQMTVTGPGDVRIRKEGTTSLKIVVPSAAVGTWKYTVKALEIPFDNLALSVEVYDKPQ
jgi:hypothetical protein